MDDLEEFRLALRQAELIVLHRIAMQVGMTLPVLPDLSGSPEEQLDELLVAFRDCLRYIKYGR